MFQKKNLLLIVAVAVLISFQGCDLVTSFFNDPPIADAGADQVAAIDTVVTLDGTRSSDPDGDSLTYSWLFSSTELGSILADRDITDSSRVRAFFTPDVEGSFIVQLDVSDGKETVSDSVTITVGTQAVQPSNPTPSNGAADQSLSVSLNWDDAQGATSYDVYFDTVDPPINQIATGVTTSGLASAELPALTEGTTYYWQVVAVFSSGVALGPVWSFTTLSSGVPQPTTNGLVAYYSFSGNANDSFGTNHGTVTGAVLTTDRNGAANSAYAFDGNDVITLANESNFDLTQFTISLTMKVSDLAANYTAISKTAGSSVDTNFRIMTVGASSLISYAHANWSGAGYTGISGGTYYHVVLTIDATTARNYINGALETTSVFGASTPGTNDGPVLIGNDQWDTFYKGTIDEVRIYNRALSAAEVQAIYDYDYR